jgi:uncharacterized repeat protein (TIGR03803 family)
MRRKRFSSLLRQFLTILALIATLVATTWAKPKFKVLAGFPNGGLWSGLTLDVKGNLYGVTTGGGDNGVGAVFEMTRNAKGQWTVTTLHSFNGKDGATPNGDLIFDGAGNLYGTTPAGGAYYDGGTVFELTPSSRGWTFSVLYSFCHEYGCPDGGGPQDGLVQDKDGNLLGTARAGLYDQGVAFELTPGSQGWTYSVLYNFGAVTNDGSDPRGTPVFDAKGKPYGTTYFGGLYASGTVFELTPGCNGWCERRLHNFCPGGYPCKDGSAPVGGVVFDTKGNLYGAANGAINNVFELTRTTNGRWKETVLYDFPNPKNGFAPITGPVLGPSGTVYGTTALGGTGSCYDGCGVVYRLSPRAGGKWQYTVLYNLPNPNESPPDGRLVLDSKGNLYGTAFSIVYEITP